MAGFTHTTAHGQLVIETFAFMAPNRRILNLPELLSAAPTRGSDKVIPAVGGVRSRRRRVASADRTLELVLRGDVDESGAITADPLATLVDLINALVELAEPVATGDGTRSATLTRPDSTTSTKPITVVGFEVGQMAGPTAVYAAFDIVIPSGRF